MGDTALTSKISYIIDTIRKCDDDIVIRHPGEVPLIPADNALSCRVNFCLSELRSLSKCVITLLPGTINRRLSSVHECSVSSILSYAVNLKYPPTDLKCFIERKEILDTLDGHNGISFKIRLKRDLKDFIERKLALDTLDVDTLCILSVRPDTIKKIWVVYTKDKVSVESIVATTTS
ncbi:hypothetical protein QYM36_005232 [Artemia franciscana]|uniref:Uncharacterized protein n=1 Tax=Artemia franciscana TaxID=6661 RepID=A0AA88LBU3_ARTSF|nr:hypothetical protein QYM36_005232 [Artemia franciscana]